MTTERNEPLVSDLQELVKTIETVARELVAAPYGSDEEQRLRKEHQDLCERYRCLT
jgi:hypothetical protein